MDLELAVLVPVLKRPHRVKPLLDAYAATTEDFEVFFIADPDDHLEIEAIREDGRGHLLIHGGTYPQKINWACQQTDHPLLFLGADDLDPQPGWLDWAKWAKDTLQGHGVVGVNDLLPRARPHATHFLITRAYAKLPCLDGSPGPMCERYQHWFCDDELISTAQYRKTYTYAKYSYVKHLHHLNGEAPRDEVYLKGESHARQDRQVFLSRERLWKSP